MKIGMRYWKAGALAGLLLPLLVAGCELIPAAPGSRGDDDAPPAYVNVVKTEEMRLQLVPRDTADAPANDHPAAFEPEQLRALLASLRVESEGEGKVTLTSPDRLRRVSEALSKALARASPKQDVSLAFFRNKSEGTFRGTSRYVTTARVFYRDETLHLVFGELDSFFSEFRDTNINPLEPGARGSAGQVNAERLVQAESWQWHGDRRDWIELPATREAIRAAVASSPEITSVGATESGRSLRHGPGGSGGDGEKAPSDASTPEAAPAPAPVAGPAADAPAQEDQATDAAPAADSSENAPAGDDDARTWARIEERLEKLRSLRERGLITEQDYEDKKAELLEELP